MGTFEKGLLRIPSFLRVLPLPVSVSYCCVRNTHRNLRDQKNAPVCPSRLGSSGLSSKLQVELRFTRYISNPSWTKRPPGASSSHGNGRNARGISRSMQWLLKTIFENCVMALILDKVNHMAKANKNGQGNILCFESEELQSPMAKNINVGK